jgi:hypothetical protein
MEQLPTSAKDAISLARRLGENYLWVDCLCVVQDDETTREQVDHMGDIYSGAHFTIIAATSFGHLSSSWVVGTRDETVEDLYNELYSSTWATRGWTFQEQMLSKRAIVFNRHLGMFWECQQCVWCPDGPRPETTTIGSACFTAPHYEKAKRMLSTCYPDFDLYTEMISLYNSRIFTYPQDVLPAFSGILTTLGKNFSSGFQYGLPRVHLDIALLWQPFRKAHRRVRRDEYSGTIAPKAHLPSWSWCGWTCPVDPYHLRTRSSYFNQSHRYSQMPVWRTQKLVQWYSLHEDLQCQVPADEPLISPVGASINHENDTMSDIPAIHIGDYDYPTEEIRVPFHSACQETTPPPLLTPTPLGASPRYIPQPHDTWPFLSCQTSCLSLYINAVHVSLPVSSRKGREKRWGYPSIFELQPFVNGPTLQNACDLICLGNREGFPAGTLRHMDRAELNLGDKVELIAISTGTIDSAGVEGDEDDKLYKLEMEAYVGPRGPVYARTSQYLGQYDNPAFMLSTPV